MSGGEVFPLKGFSVDIANYLCINNAYDKDRRDFERV
jgi:hypothetical protein